MKPVSYPACATATDDEAGLPDVPLIVTKVGSTLHARPDPSCALPQRSGRGIYLDQVLAVIKRDITLWSSLEHALQTVLPSQVVVLTAHTPALEATECNESPLATVKADTVYFHYALFRDAVPLGFRLAIFTYIFGYFARGHADITSEPILDAFPVSLLIDQVSVLQKPAKYGFVSEDAWLERLRASLAQKLPPSLTSGAVREFEEHRGAHNVGGTYSKRGAALSAKQLQYVEDFSTRNKVQKKLLLTKMRTLLSILSTALGESVAINVVPGEWWAYDPEEGTITFPLIDLVTASPEHIMGAIFHEVAHYQITRVNANDAVFAHLLSTDSKRLLLNTFEDPRATNWMLDVFPGTTPYLDTIYDDLLAEDLSRAPYVYKLQKEAQKRASSVAQGYRVLPHVEYLLSVLYYWRFGSFPSSIATPSVKQALESTVSFFPTIFNHYAHGRASEHEKRRYAREAAEQIIDHILGPYERLLEEAERNLGQTIERGQQPIGEGEDPSEIHPQTLEQEAHEVIEAQSKELADRLSAKGAPHQSLNAEALERHATTPRDSSDGAAISKDKPRAELTRQDLIAQRRQVQSELADSIEEYNRLYARVSSVLQPLVGTLENVLAKNRKPKYEGYYVTGQKPDVRKVMDVSRKVQEGLPTARRDFAVFLKRRRPTHLDHRVMLLVDESGSMHEPKRTAVLEGVLLFAEALEYLGISYAVIGFSDTPIVHKSFSDAFSHRQRINLVNDVSQLIPGGATADADALALGVELFEQEPEDLYRLMLVISDGEGNVNTTGRTFSELQEAAQAKGITVLGVGIGDAAEAITARYSYPLQVQTVAELPARLSEVLQKEVIGNAAHS